MQIDRFADWLAQQGQALSSIRTRLSDAKRVEKHLGDLDAAFAQDGGSSILAALTYTSADRAAGKANTTGIEIDGDLYDSMASFKAAVTAYLKFLNDKDASLKQSQADSIREYVSKIYAAPAKAKGQTLFNVVSGDIHKEMGLNNAMPSVCQALDGKIFAELIGAKLVEREGPNLSSTVSYTFQFADDGPFDIAAAEKEMRKRYGAPLQTATGTPNEKIISFELPDGRQIALERKGDSIRIWLEDSESETPPPCQQFTSYYPDKGRQANLPVRLKHKPPAGIEPRPVMKLSIPNHFTLNAVLNWYEAMNEDSMQLTREAVFQAMDECDQLSVEGFLQKYQFDQPRRYWISERGKLYPSKAVANVALKSILPSSPEIDATQSKQRLERLGFLIFDELAKGEGASATQAASTATPAPSPTNLILYGPPGTGKTYRTAYEAVTLCDGSAPSDRNDLKDRYDVLVEAGQIRFVTFHQSYAYEDFVEGLRPVTGADDGQPAASAGFRLEPRQGIFREIAALAEQARRNEGRSTGYDLTGKRCFKMSLGRAGSEDHIFDAAIDGNYIVLGWGGEIDWSDPRYENFQAIFDKWNEIEPGTSGIAGNISQLWTFRSSIKLGDIVIVSDGNSNFRAIGEVTGPYEYAPTDIREYNHRRAVKWLLVLDESLPVETIHDGKFTMRSCYELRSSRIKVEALSRLLPGMSTSKNGRPDQFVLVIDEINRANISKVFGELITLIEGDKRLGSENALTVKLPYSGDVFGIPNNLHILGTMNTADRSIALLDTALRRRFTFKELMPDPTALEETAKRTGVNLPAVLKSLNDRIEFLFDREHQIGHAYFMPCNTPNDVDEVMRFKIIPLLAEYFYEDWSKVALVLGDADGAGNFIQRVKLDPPSGIPNDGFEEARYRWVVRTEFPESAYDQFI